MKKGDFSKLIVCLILFLNIAFTIAVLAVFWHTGGNEPSSLVVSWFAFTGTELVSLASIKKRKIDSGYDEKDENNGFNDFESEVDMNGRD